MPVFAPRRQAVRPSRRRHARHWAACALAPLALAARLAHGAAFAPGVEADPATGAVQALPPAPEEPLRGEGIQWALAPWRVGGTLALDVRALRLGDGGHATSRVMLGDIDAASHVWQPWFIQVRAGFGWVLADANAAGSRPQLSLTGRGALSVFPASRFPFELRVEQNDSRADGANLIGDYRSRRISLSQGWRPRAGARQLQLQLEHSRIDAQDAGDRLWLFNASAQDQQGPQRLEFGTSLSDHRRLDVDEHTRLASASARHAWQPSTTWQTDTLLTWNELQLRGDALDLSSEVRQVSSFVHWQPSSDSGLGGRHTAVTGSARYLQARSANDGGRLRSEAVNVSAGLSHELSADWRATASGSISRLSVAGGARALFKAVNGSASWTPSGTAWGDWRYAPNAGLNLGLSDDGDNDLRRFGGVQAGHSVSRDWALGEVARLTFSASQSAAWFDESGPAEATRALAHGASLGWQGPALDRGQAFAALSYNDALSDGATRGRFQLVNLQLSQRVPLSRYASWGAHLTMQATRNRATDVDPFTGEPREQATGWQTYHNGAASFEHARLFDVPRLRLSLTASASSQQFDRRQLGDIDAPLERVSASFEARLDWSIGRLETRLSARVARVEGRNTAALFARAQRRF